MHTVCVDLSDWAATRKAVEEIGPIDLLVNDAGIISHAPFVDTDENSLDKYGVTFATNCTEQNNLFVYTYVNVRRDKLCHKCFDKFEFGTHVINYQLSEKKAYKI